MDNETINATPTAEPEPEPVSLAAALGTFERLWSPRIVTRVNDYDVRVAKVAGDHIWHVHDDTDEFFLVLSGELRIDLRPATGDADDAAAAGGADGAERSVTLAQGSVFVVPRGTPHRPSSAGGASILMFEPSGTPTVGDRHEEVPGHVDAHTGVPLGR